MCPGRSQSVREVHHGVHLASGAQPCTLPDLRLRVAVHGGERRVVPSGEDVPQSGARGSQFARDEDDVALPGGVAAFDVCVGGAADGRDVDRDAPGRAGRVASDERRAVAGRQLAVSLHELRGPGILRIGGERQGEQRGDGMGAHRRDVAQVDGQRFAAQFAGRGRGPQEVHPLGQQVGGEEQRRSVAERQHGAVVADALEAVVREFGEEPPGSKSNQV